MDWRVFAFISALTLLTALVFGLVPALRATRVDLASDLKDTSRSLSGGRSALSKSLLVAQVAITLVLLVGAGMFLRTVRNLRDVAVGFNPQNVMTFDLSFRAIDPRSADWRTRRPLLADRVLEKVGGIPGVRSIGGTSVPIWHSRFVNERPFFIQGMKDPIVANVLGVSPGFFDTMQVPLVAGRLLATSDVVTPFTAVVIDATAAQRFFPGQEAVGHRIGNASNPGLWEVVGVVGHATYGDVRNPAEPLVYMPGRQTTFVVRTDGNPMRLASGIRDAVRQIDPTVAVTGITTQTDLTEGRIQPERLFARFYTLFGALALMLASIGLLGLMSYNVSRRTHEIGVRMALGARRDDVVRLVMRESLTLVLIGVVIGIAAALAAGRLIASQLYGLAAHDGVSIATAIALMLAVSVLAGYLPSRRASRIDPLSALRHE